ncbi:MAG TPA: hypothetical protein VMM37_07955, partial [Bacteroidota bacterium]|nr:hypothetical protein [Bacteroidota bacterium]
METLRTDQSTEWLRVLQSIRKYDFYHLPSYHKLAEQHGEGVAELFVHREGPYLIAIPLVLRSISSAGELDGPGIGLNDATSVYGYAGPLASDDQIPEEVIRNFQTGLRESLGQRNVVSV